MTDLPHNAQRRAPRVQLSDLTPAVLRLADGDCKQGELRTISLTGGLLCQSQMLDQGSFLKLMFLTATGPVLGVVQMLNPVGTDLQPFRFVSLHPSDQRKLAATIQSSLERNSSDEEWIGKYRAAMAREGMSRRGLISVCLGAATLVTLSLASIFYVLHVYPLR